MQNLSNRKLTAAQFRFLDEFAALVADWNMPKNMARVYGFLLLQNEPASLDQIAEALEISKSNACTAAKQLETWGHCRRVGERGTKRVLYVAREDLGISFLLRTASLGQLNKLLEASARGLAKGPVAERLSNLASFYGTMQTAMEEVVAAETKRAAGAQNNRSNK